MATRIRLCNVDPSNNQENFRYLNKNTTSNERLLYNSYWDELVNLYGTRVEYYRYEYSLTGHNFLYGEQPTTRFSGPYIINIMCDIPSEALLLSKFGYDTNAQFVAVITITDFEQVFGKNAEPKSGDVLRLIETGWREDENPESPSQILSALCSNLTPAACATFTYTVSDYEWVRCPQIYEITERDHQDFSTQNNVLFGHYIWMIKGKRFDYSYQPGITPECKQGIIGEETFSGRLSGGLSGEPPSPDKLYDGNINDFSNETIWDYASGNETRPSDVYGGY